MNKSKKMDTKKILVRNTERPVPKTVLVLDEKLEGKEKKSEHKALRDKKTVDKTSEKSANYRPRFRSPELNSALQIAKKIDKVEKTKVQKAPDVAFCEKMTRKINFPSDRPIYKDLIPLEVRAKSPPVLTSREPLPLKDKEPSLSSFAKKREVKEFIYEPTIKPDLHSTVPGLNNLRLYKILQIHESM